MKHATDLTEKQTDFLAFGNGFKLKRARKMSRQMSGQKTAAFLGTELAAVLLFPEKNACVRGVEKN